MPLLSPARRALIAGLFVAGVANAQGLRVVQPPPDCNLLRQAWDNPYDDVHLYRQPRIAWHAEYAIGTAALSWAIHKTTRLPRWASATIASVGIGVLPHVRSVFILRHYPINPGDLAFDAVNRSTPFIFVSSRPPTRWKAFGVWLAADLALSCFASP
jgi:hypothetical protein